jgi:hypothetical protein
MASALERLDQQGVERLVVELVVVFGLLEHRNLLGVRDET